MAVSIIIVLFLLFVEIFGVKYIKESQNVLNYQFTKILKGVCCFPVIFSHIYAPYDNECQSWIGSFAFIAVALYFLFASYGLEVSVINKKDYLSHFFVNRFSKILVPYILCILIRFLFHTHLTYGGANFVHVLIVYYIIFYFAHTKFLDGKKREVFLLICTLGYSIGGFFLGYKLHLPVIGLKWYPESLGLTLGIIIAYHYDRINLFFKRNIALKTVIMFAVAFFLKYSYTHYIYKYYFIGNYIYRMLMGISVIVFITLLLTHIKLGNPLSTKLGDLSFEIFLYHGLFLQWLITLPVQWTSNTYIMAVIVCTVSTAIIMNKIGVFIIKRLISINNT